MSVVIVTNEEYEIKQGKTAIILSDRSSITIQAKYDEGTIWATLASASSDGSFTIPFLKEAKFRVSAQSGGNESRFDYSPQT